MNALATRLATDGRFIVTELHGHSFWPGQPSIADCGISASHRPPEATQAYAEALTSRYNAHNDLVRALYWLAEIVGTYRERVIKGEITGNLLEHDFEALDSARKVLLATDLIEPGDLRE